MGLLDSPPFQPQQNDVYKGVAIKAMQSGMPPQQVMQALAARKTGDPANDAQLDAAIAWIQQTLVPQAY